MTNENISSNSIINNHPVCDDVRWNLAFQPRLFMAWSRRYTFDNLRHSACHNLFHQPIKQKTT
jgi:hypothetical protein